MFRPHPTPPTFSPHFSDKTVTGRDHVLEHANKPDASAAVAGNTYRSGNYRESTEPLESRHGGGAQVFYMIWTMTWESPGDQAAQHPENVQEMRTGIQALAGGPNPAGSRGETLVPYGGSFSRKPPRRAPKSTEKTRSTA
jgi:hypothetical protein